MNWNSARWRLFALVMVVTIPVLVVQLIGAWSDLRQDIADRESEVLHVSAHAQADFANLMELTRSVFADMVRVNGMRGPDNCTQVYSSLRFAYERLAPKAVNLGLADAQGNIYCSVNPVQAERNITGHPYFQNALKTLDLSLGTYAVNPLKGAPSIAVAYPVLSFDGTVQTVIIASFEVQWLTVWQTEVSLPPGTALTLFTLDGKVLQRWVDGAAVGAAGGQESYLWFTRLQNGNKVSEGVDLDGVNRLNTLVPLREDAQSTSFAAAYLHLGYPVAELYTRAYQSLWWKLALLGLTTLGALLFARWGSERFLLLPLGQMMDAVSHVQAGNLGARAATVGGLSELGQLAQSFDRMADALQQREAARQQSEARFQAMFETAAVGIGILSLDRKIMDANPAVCRMLGRSKEEMIGQTPAFVTYPGDYPNSTQGFEELITGVRTFYIDERRYVRKSGEVFWVHITMTVVRDAGGAPLYLVGMLIDINEQRRVLAELKESEERFRAVYQNAAIGISLVAPDRKVLAVNPILIKMSGYSEAELISLGGLAITYSEDQEIGQAEFQEILAGTRQDYQVEKRYVHKDGRIHWMRQTISAVRDSGEKLLYLVAIAEDIDEQKHAVEELRESEERFRVIYDHAEMGIVVTDLDDEFDPSGQLAAPDAHFWHLVASQRVNPALQRMFGYTAEELKHLDLLQLVHPEDRGKDAQLSRELFDGKRDSYAIEKRYVCKDGGTFWGRLNYTLVRDAGGHPRKAIGIIEDINEQKLTAEKLAAQEADYLQNLERRINERTAELNQANALLQQKAALEAVTAERTRLARDLHDAVTQTLFSATLISDVLPDVWEMDPARGKQSLNELRQLTRGALAEMRTLLVELRPNALVEVPLSTLLRQLTEAITGRARLQVQLSVEGARTLPPEVQIGLYRIAQESLNNVAKHARATQAVLTLRLGAPVRLTVADNGVGFDPSTVTADHLGLKIMRERAENFGAKLSIYSEPGEGTQISVVWE